MPLPTTTDDEVRYGLPAQLLRFMNPPTPFMERMTALAEALAADEKRKADHRARKEREAQDRQDEVWQARADERGEGDGVEA